MNDSSPLGAHLENTGTPLPVSLCMIVKNEAANLGACLDSVAGLVAEIIIVDTGSTDGTCELATKKGAKLLHTVWEQDFSKARNLGLAEAVQPWILVLDADESFLEPDRVALRELLAQHPVPDAGYALLQNSSSDGGKTGLLVSIVRLFPNRPEIRYEWPVHEQPVTSLQRAGLPIHKTSIRFLHTGYSNEVVNQEKQRRNLAILRTQLAGEGEGQRFPLAWFLAASSHLDLGEHLEALAAYDECRQRCDEGSELALGATVGAVLCLVRLGRYAEAISRMPAPGSADWHPRLLSMRAKCEDALGRPEEARCWHERVLACEHRDYIPPCNVAAEKTASLLWLASYLRGKGEATLSVAILKQALHCRQTGEDFRPEHLAALVGKHPC